MTNTTIRPVGRPHKNEYEEALNRFAGLVILESIYGHRAPTSKIDYIRAWEQCPELPYCATYYAGLDGNIVVYALDEENAIFSWEYNKKRMKPQRAKIRDSRKGPYFFADDQTIRLDECVRNDTDPLMQIQREIKNTLRSINENKGGTPA